MCGKILIPNLFVVVFAASSPLNTQRVIYVAESATGTGDGTSWADAYPDLQDALEDARVAGDLDAEIWIAAGTYKPDRGTGDRTMAYELFGNIGLYGGFSATEECREHRDSNVNITTLSGDLVGDDDFNAEPASDCCIATLNPTCGDEVCRAAVASSQPYCAEEWDQGCTGEAFFACCDLCRPSRCDNSFNLIRATEPGSAPVVDGLTIRDGEAFDPQYAAYAGGLYARETSPQVYGCHFLRNGGQSAFYSDGGSPSLEGTSFLENGLAFPPSRTVTIWNPTGIVTLYDLEISYNHGTGIMLHGFPEQAVRNCTIRNNGIGLLCDDDCTVLGSKFIANRGGGIIADGQPTIIDSQFLRNTRNGVFTYSGALVINSVFAGNMGNSSAALSAGSAYVLNSVFYKNSEGAMGVSGNSTIRNSIFWGNHDRWGNVYQNAQFHAPSTVFIDVDYSIVHGWTGSWGGVGNSGLEPLFVNADGPDGIPGTEDDDLRLLPGSPGINAGDPNEIYLLATDLDEHARVLCDRVDIGAYEFGIGDYNCDQSINLTDFAAWSYCMTGPGGTSISAGCEAFDFNADSAVDLLDFAEFQNAFTSSP